MTIFVGAICVYVATCFLAACYLLTRSNRKTLAMIIAAFDAPLASLDDSAAKIAVLVANPTLPDGAASAQDVADTLDAVTTKAAAVASAIPEPAP